MWIAISLLYPLESALKQQQQNNPITLQAPLFRERSNMALSPCDDAKPEAGFLTEEEPLTESFFTRVG